MYPYLGETFLDNHIIQIFGIVTIYIVLGKKLHCKAMETTTNLIRYKLDTVTFSIFIKRNNMKSLLSWLVLIVSIAVLVSSCAKSDDSETVYIITTDNSTTTTDTTAPTVSSTSPANNATNVSVSGAITVTFSEEMDSSTITTSTFTVNNASGSVTYSNKVATFTPSTSLNFSNTYTATITTGVKDTADNAMAANHTWTFTTEGGNYTILEVVGGENHTCSRLANGKIKCWGKNNYGQLGQGNTNDLGDAASEMGNNLTAVDLGTDKSALQVVTGADHTCALLDDSTVKCWGYNAYGQLGRGTTDAIGDASGEMGDNLTAIDLGSGRTAVEIAAGKYHTCARLDNSSVKCWGRNDQGQLGQDSTNNLGDNASEMGDNLTAITLGLSAVEITTGANHTCTRLNNSSVKCWGKNEYGQLGQDNTNNLGDGTGEMAALIAVTLASSAVELAAGENHTCARLDTGGLRCWGYNDEGQLGHGNTSNQGDNANEMAALSAVDLGTNKIAVAITAGNDHTCALLDDGKVKCWGGNTFGQLGQKHDDPNAGATASSMADNLIYSDLGTGRTALGISAGSIHTCVQLDNGRLKCWGKNAFGQLGLGHTNPHGKLATEMGDNLSMVELGMGVFSAVKLAVGDYHSCVNLGYSSVKCWGRNDSGQLGQGNTSNIGDASSEMGNNLSAIDFDGKVVEVAVGKNHSCVRLDNSSVKCWGDNEFGQLGIDNSSDIGDGSGEMGSNLTVINLGTNKKAVEITTGGDHTCARLDDHTIKCWGYNGFGQLGQGSTSNIGDGSGEMTSLSVITLPTGRTALQVAAGENFTCARLDDGTVICWGINSNGQLGQDDTTHRGDGSGAAVSALTAISLGKTAVQVVAGYTHACALLEDSTVKCWGHNGGSDGKLGLESLDESRGVATGEMAALSTIDFGTNRIALQIAAGSLHTCALLDNGTVKCWGNNDYGQLGLGDRTARGSGSGDMGTGLAAVDLGASAIEISSGFQHSCALLVNGKVKCWGFNQFGQLGLGDTNARGDSSGEMGSALSYISLGSN